jgi:hypothetical protein
MGRIIYYCVVPRRPWIRPWVVFEPKLPIRRVPYLTGIDLGAACRKQASVCERDDGFHSTATEAISRVHSPGYELCIFMADTVFNGLCANWPSKFQKTL